MTFVMNMESKNVENHIMHEMNSYIEACVHLPTSLYVSFLKLLNEF